MWIFEDILKFYNCAIDSFSAVFIRIVPQTPLLWQPDPQNHKHAKYMHKTIVSLAACEYRLITERRDLFSSQSILTLICDIWVVCLLSEGRRADESQSQCRSQMECWLETLICNEEYSCVCKWSQERSRAAATGTNEQQGSHCFCGYW